ncbi:TolC family outer membrane protein [Pseudooceanicola sp. CBS1P-1]|uniref:TolC family outer membrane protein n=1 Tax=Pseudooceanicola albus TaxID=2692189 RepID=A0A6L7G645_9RHOB|nr:MULTISPECIES: TolC family outer membrane protein [Pseudooceanicola]MBT9385622.1 TolC family outer membrane protein [Pseudooceanicola endophyticus]MXN18968.1 TolC family outer membrane protein [Pseudooceanicola albus]
MLKQDGLPATGRAFVSSGRARRALRNLAFGSVLGLLPGLAGAETMGQTLADAYRNSGLLEQNRAVLEAADEDAAQALASLRPILSWSVSADRSVGDTYVGSVKTTSAATSTSAGLSLSLLLWDGGATRTSLSIAKETVLLTRQQLLQVEQQVLLRAATAYMEVRRAADTLSLRQANVKLLEQELQAARDRFDVGEVTRTDVAQAESALATARSALTSAQGTLEQAKLEYTAAVGHAPGNLSSPDHLGTIPPTSNEAVNIALKTHPSMDVARRQVTVAQLQVAVADAGTKPSLDLTGSYGYSDSAVDDDTHQLSGTVGLSLSGPIYSGGALASAKRSALLNQKATMANLHVVTDDIRQSAASAWSDIQIARAATVSGKEAVRAAEVAFNGVREEANLGSRTTLDVLTQEQDLLDARVTYLSSQVDEVEARYTLLSAMGLLTAQNLKLAVDIYDPAAYYNMVKNAPAEISSRGRQLDKMLRAIGQN